MDNPEKQNSARKQKSFWLVFLITLLLPFYLIYRLIKSSNKFEKGGKRTVLNILVLSVLTGLVIPLWMTFYLVSANSGYVVLLRYAGYTDEPIQISGTGSMYPTFPKGEGKDPKLLSKQIISTQGMIPYPNGFKLFGKTYFAYQLKRGDIVAVANQAIEELNRKVTGNDEKTGWVKRIIGLPGDTLELKEGIVYLNGQPQKEAYTSQPHSTFGESFLKDCRKITIPGNKIFVMGDNRKGSGDSREIGFIDMGDVDHVLPLEKQAGILDKNWRDTSKDLEESSKIRLDVNEYINLLNEKRKAANLKPLWHEPKLDRSSEKRGKVILQYDDFSYEATRSGYTQKKAMTEANYSNITYGEIPTLGYFSAQELFESQFEFPAIKEFLLNKDFQDIGISQVEGDLNGCPAQVIVQHVAGYVPPNYKQEEIQNWQNGLDQLKKIEPGWRDLKNNTVFYQKHKDEVGRLNEIISLRISRLESIVSSMKANKWFSEEQDKWINEDPSLYEEQQTLAQKLNSY